MQQQDITCEYLGAVSGEALVKWNAHDNTEVTGEVAQEEGTKKVCLLLFSHPVAVTVCLFWPRLVNESVWYGSCPSVDSKNWKTKYCSEEDLKTAWISLARQFWNVIISKLLSAKTDCQIEHLAHLTRRFQLATKLDDESHDDVNSGLLSGSVEIDKEP